MRIVAAALAVGLCLVAPLPAAQSTDLDRLMERVLTRRDENWKKLQQYVLDERETFDLTGPGGARRSEQLVVAGAWRTTPTVEWRFERK